MTCFHSPGSGGSTLFNILLATVLCLSQDPEALSLPSELDRKKSVGLLIF